MGGRRSNVHGRENESKHYRPVLVGKDLQTKKLSDTFPLQIEVGKACKAKKVRRKDQRIWLRACRQLDVLTYFDEHAKSDDEIVDNPSRAAGMQSTSTWSNAEG